VRPVFSVLVAADGATGRRLAFKWGFRHRETGVEITFLVLNILSNHSSLRDPAFMPDAV
jgi:hypothetical protein